MTKAQKQDTLSGATYKLVGFLTTAKPAEVLELFTYESDNAARPHVLRRLAARFNTLNMRRMLTGPHRGLAKAKKDRADGR